MGIKKIEHNIYNQLQCDGVVERLHVRANVKKTHFSIWYTVGYILILSGGRFFIHQLRVTQCPVDFPAGYYWYGCKQHSTPRWLEDISEEGSLAQHVYTTVNDEASVLMCLEVLMT